MDQILFGVILMAGVVILGTVLPRFTPFAHLMFQLNNSKAYFVVLGGFLYSALLAGSFLSSMRMSSDYAQGVDWKSGTIEFSPCWLIYCLFFSLTFLLYQFLRACNLESISSTLNRCATVCIYILESIAWGSIVGSQTDPLSLWLTMICGCVALSALCASELSPKWRLVNGGVTAVVYPLLACITMFYVMNAKDRIASSAMLSVFAGVQSVVALYHINEIYSYQVETKLLVFLRHACLLLGTTFSLLLFIFCQRRHEAFFDFFITSVNE
eukprot:GHVH01010986.1.p1 GENE.GHVH01010986.1~~GHVH01010986.1.p1  ORF type:complete len:269 (+),score=21.97 GHVH01010986.1:624-1430(+)